MSKFIELKQREFSPRRSYLILGVSFLVTAIATYIIYQNTQWYFKWSLQQRVRSIVQTASVQFDPKELDKIEGMESVGKGTYEKIVKELQAIRFENPNTEYLYIQRKTEDPNTLVFVADADALHPDKPSDLNANGEIDEDEELSKPGDEYDVSEYPDFVKIAFTSAYVDDSLSIDQWGTHLSATAPIRGDGNDIRYLIGVDMDVSDYVRLTNLAYIPFILFGIFLLLVLTALTVSLVKMWNGRVQLLKDLDRQKDELLGIVSHQLATPITSVKWYIEMLTSGDVGKITKEQEDHLNSVLSITADLSDLVSMILDVSRIQLGKMRIEKKELDVSILFKEIIEVVSPKAQQKEIDLKISIPKNLKNAFLDKRYTRMTVENLLTNAIKYTPSKGKVSFDVTLSKTGEILFCKVQDTGCGIPKGEQNKVFSRMFRASNVRNSIDGNGFGLYVAKGAIEAQGGKIWFESAEGKGTTFYIELPLK